ncbi:hypothetical protein MKJ01_18665, partial [Chryseobacterium sp. SSA4.19]|uniref:SpvB/TcaC N-terminal domain-containing protein n=1 Tax=Chryseobacterium sp. SSA4.19 TaxID=2919915 RepID=UPI001F4EED2B
MKKYIMLLVLFCFADHYSAQQIVSPSTLPNIVPPSPSAYALGNYGNIPIGLFVGSPNISIPLLRYRTNNISLPLNLFYGSNGIKVDEVSSNVGLGWNLNFGGVITRMVRDLPDELNPNSYVPDNVTGDITNSISMQFFQDGGRGNMDTEIDLYSYNFNGISGKFFYDRNHKPHLVDQKQAIKIERIGNTNGDGQDFLLILPTGEQYYFTEKERTTYRTSGSGHSLPQSAISAWYLTKIVHQKGDEIYFSYDPTSMEYISSQSQTMTMSYPKVQTNCTNPYILAPTISSLIDQNMDINGKKIKSISSNNPTDGSISFIYSTDTSIQDVDGSSKVQYIILKDKNNQTIESINFNYLGTSNKRIFLNNIAFKDPNKVYSFEYEKMTDFPLRLSKSQDHWGYHNGVYNSTLVPNNIKDYDLSSSNYPGADKEPHSEYAKVGMLKKIIYPTKGYTELEYEGNTYWGEKTIYPSIFTKQLQIKTDVSTDSDLIEYTFVSPINQRVTVNATLFGNSISQCSSFVSSGHYSGSIQLVGTNFFTQTDLGLSNEGSTVALTRDHASHQLYFNANAGSTYKIILNANFMCSNVKASISYYQTAPQTFNTNLDTGGVRVKSTKDFDSSNNQPQYKRFFYAHKDDINHSSGKIGRKPYYIDFIQSPSACSVACSDSNYNQNLVLTSSSLINLFDTGSNNCIYEYVVTSNGGDNFENGGEMKTFKIHRDYFGNNLLGSNILSSPWTNFGWDNGVELKSTLFSKNTGSQNFNIIRELNSEYEVNTVYNYELKNYNFRQKYDVSCGNNISKVCTAEDVLKSFTYTNCLANHTHVWTTSDDKCHANGANNVTHTIPDACYGKPIGATVTYPNYLKGLDVVEYKSISYWHYLKSQKTTDYVGGIPIKTDTEYFYNNPSHLQLSKQITTSPDNSITENTYQYAHEKSNQKLIAANMVGIPLETTTVKKQNANDPGKTVSKTEVIYPDQNNYPTPQAGSLLLPLSVTSSDQLTGVMSTDVSYDKYDQKGNILQYTTKDG